MSKHMCLEDRHRIESGLSNGESFNQISVAIGKSRSTITREVRSHRIVWDYYAYGRIKNRCKNRFDCGHKHLCNPDCNRQCSLCRKCNSSCPDFVEDYCQRLSMPPYVCNGCENIAKCQLEKFRYDASYAQKEYRNVLKESREGFNLSEQELKQIDDTISPLLCNGQSVHHAVLACKERLTVSDRTVYRLTDKSALKARNIDLPRKCKLKPRKGIKPKLKIDRNCRVGRLYSDYLSYLENNPDTPVVQMDTVEGCRNSSKCLLTFCFTGSFMPAFLRDSNTSASVLEWIEFLYTGLGHDDFCRLFPVILTDNGTEFSNPALIEFAQDGRRRTRVFFCDPMASYQKPHVERCHEQFRRVLPKGTSFDNLSQDDIAVVASHVNSYACHSLNDKSPMDALAFHYGQELADKLLHLLCLKKIPPQEIVLLPGLIRH